MVALLIPEHQLGTAYGVMQAIQNFGLGVVVQTAGMLRDKFGFAKTEYYFLMWMTRKFIYQSQNVLRHLVSSDHNSAAI